jgi:hypothetical protein
MAVLPVAPKINTFIALSFECFQIPRSNFPDKFPARLPALPRAYGIVKTIPAHGP